MTESSIISKVWKMANVLRDDEVGYGDYLEQIIYLLFLKMADEMSRPPYAKDVGIPEEFNRESITSKRGADLESHYTKLLRAHCQQKGALGQIFTPRSLITATVDCVRQPRTTIIHDQSCGTGGFFLTA